MREVNIEGRDPHELAQEGWKVAHWSSDEQLLEAIDECLEEHGLELVKGDFGTADYIVKIDKREG